MVDMYVSFAQRSINSLEVKRTYNAFISVVFEASLSSLSVPLVLIYCDGLACPFLQCFKGIQLFSQSYRWGVIGCVPTTADSN